MEFGQCLSLQINPGYIMRSIILFLLVSISFTAFTQDTFQLAPPLLKYSSAFFSNRTVIEIKFAQSGTMIHYTLNNREPTVNDAVYTKPVIIKNNFTTLKAKAFGNKFYPSQVTTVTFIKEGLKVKSVEQTIPNIKYRGIGSTTLIDNKGGIAQLSNNTWMGYNCDTVTITMNLPKEQAVSKVLFNFLQDEGSWVFLPDEIIVNWFDIKSNLFKPLAKEKIPEDTATSGSRCTFRIIETKNKVLTDKILINIIVKKNIPAWHPAKGEHAWMFIDEIKVY